MRPDAEKNPRVRVSADDPVPGGGRGVTRGVPTRGIALPGEPVRDADAVFARGLMRAQLRLAVGILGGFLIVAGALAVALVVAPELGDPVVAGVPLSWLLHAYGFYPISLFFAILFARGAARNEKRYQALRVDSGSAGEAEG